MRLARRSRSVEPAVGAFAVRVTKFLFFRFGNRKMREIDRIAENAKRHEREFIQVRSPLEENQLETEMLARNGFAVSGIIPPFGLGVFMRVKIARQFDRIEFRAVAQGVGFAQKSVGRGFDKLGRRFFDVF